MGDQLSEANRALIERVMGAYASVWFREYDKNPDTAIELFMNAARSEGPHPDQSAEVGNMVPHLESGEAVAWRVRTKRPDGSYGAWWVTEKRPEPSNYVGGYGVEVRELVDRAYPPPLEGEALPVVSEADLPGENPVLAKSLLKALKWVPFRDPDGTGEAETDRALIQACLNSALYARPSPGVSREKVARAVADGFSNGNEQYAEASPAQRGRYDMAADAVLSLLSRGEG